jgi:hypothetical protein
MCSRELEWERITRDSTVLKNVTTWWINFPGYYVIQKNHYGAIAANCCFIIFLLDAIMYANS